jgi:hypothetical protein
MIVPRYWAHAEGAATDPSGKRYRLRLWGWSHEVVAAALAEARRRVAEISSRITRGETLDAYFYGRQPLREEIVRSVGSVSSSEVSSSEAIVTRNRYGALVLNTAEVPFIDVDAPPGGGLSMLAGLFGRRKSTDPTLDGIRLACQRRGDHTFRVYRTKSGYRVLATDLLLDPVSAAAQELLAEFAADAHFTRLCRQQGSFRARLTPKPWRCGCSLPPGRFPREERALQERFEAWLDEYANAGAPFATCKFLETIGPGRTARKARVVVEEHDRVSLAFEELPLA